MEVKVEVKVDMSFYVLSCTQCITPYLTPYLTSSYNFQNLSYYILYAYEQKVYNHRRDSQEGTIETVQHTAVTRQDVPAVLDAKMTLHETLDEIAPGTEHHDNQREAQPFP